MPRINYRNDINRIAGIGAPQGGSRQGAGKKIELAAHVAAEGRFPMKGGG
jgi:hypothetical protein